MSGIKYGVIDKLQTRAARDSNREKYSGCRYEGWIVVLK